MSRIISVSNNGCRYVYVRSSRFLQGGSFGAWLGCSQTRTHGWVAVSFADTSIPKGVRAEKLQKPLGRSLLKTSCWPVLIRRGEDAGRKAVTFGIMCVGDFRVENVVASFEGDGGIATGVNAGAMLLVNSALLLIVVCSGDVHAVSRALSKSRRTPANADEVGNCIKARHQVAPTVSPLADGRWPMVRQS